MQPEPPYFMKFIGIFFLLLFSVSVSSNYICSGTICHDFVALIDVYHTKYYYGVLSYNSSYRDAEQLEFTILIVIFISILYFFIRIISDIIFDLTLVSDKKYILALLFISLCSLYIFSLENIDNQKTVFGLSARHHLIQNILTISFFLYADTVMIVEIICQIIVRLRRI